MTPPERSKASFFPSTQVTFRLFWKTFCRWGRQSSFLGASMVFSENKSILVPTSCLNIQLSHFLNWRVVTRKYLKRSDGPRYLRDSRSFARYKWIKHPEISFGNCLQLVQLAIHVYQSKPTIRSSPTTMYSKITWTVLLSQSERGYQNQTQMPTEKHRRVSKIGETTKN